MLSDRAVADRWAWRYTPRVILIVIVLVLAVIGVVRLAKTLEPSQRVVLVVVFLLGVVYVASKLMQLGLLGRQTAQ